MEAIVGQFLIQVKAFEDAAPPWLKSILELQLEEAVEEVEDGFKCTQIWI